MCLPSVAMVGVLFPSGPTSTYGDPSYKKNCHTHHFPMGPNVRRKMYPFMGF